MNWHYQPNPKTDIIFVFSFFDMDVLNGVISMPTVPYVLYLECTSLARPCTTSYHKSTENWSSVEVMLSPSPTRVTRYGDFVLLMRLDRPRGGRGSSFYFRYIYLAKTGTGSRYGRYCTVGTRRNDRLAGKSYAYQSK